MWLMSFDPRIIPADEAPLARDGSLLLPDDLQELAAQLTDDALHLSTLYPAQPPQQLQLAAAAPAMRSPFKSRAALLLTLASVVLVAASVLVWERWSAAVAIPSLAVSSHLNAIESANDLSAGSLSSETEYPVSFEPMQLEGLLLYEYSGPELEGVYDLLEAAPQQEISF
jgi:hypothetical protein